VGSPEAKYTPEIVTNPACVEGTFLGLVTAGTGLHVVGDGDGAVVGDGDGAGVTSTAAQDTCCSDML
jgi:hypothetical protein